MRSDGSGPPLHLERELAVAREAAVEAGELVRAAFGSPRRFRRKGPHDVGTPADAASERLIARRLLAAFPLDRVAGEEGGLRAARKGEGGPGARTWLVDPIDGTINFVSEAVNHSVSGQRPANGACVGCPARWE